LTASVALVPWLTGAFRGYIVGLWHQGVLYRFATYTGARIDTLQIDDQRVDWVLHDRRFRLEMHVQRAQTGLLRGPTGLDMGGRVPESLQAVAQVRLTTLQGDVLFADTGRHGGLEIVNGDALV
jgi:hypothetical protein